MNIWNHVNEEILVRAQETNNPQNTTLFSSCVICML